MSTPVAFLFATSIDHFCSDLELEKVAAMMAEQGPRPVLLQSLGVQQTNQTHVLVPQTDISRSLFQDIEGGEEGEAGDPPIRVDQETLRVWADGRPHRVNIPLKYQVCRQWS